jgi:hypothetical protein
MLAAETSSALNTIIATGARTILINEVPKPWWIDATWRPSNCSALAADIDIERCAFPNFDPRSTKKFETVREVQASIVAATGVETWNLEDAICPEHRCSQFVDGTPTFGDDGHIASAGNPRLQERILELLQTP